MVTVYCCTSLERLAVAQTSLCVLAIDLGSCVGLGLGIGFREWVPFRNIIGGAAGAHIPMRSGYS